MSQFRQDAKDAGYGYAWLVIGVIALAAIVIMVWGIGYGFRWSTAPARGKLQAREQINSGAFRIAAYNHFFDLCAAVQTDETRLDAQREELKTATGDDVGRVQANIAGITSDRAEAINEYNADASKDYTVGQFRASKLPFQLSTDPYGKEHTRCAAS